MFIALLFLINSAALVNSGNITVNLVYSYSYRDLEGLMLWCLTPLSTIFTNNVVSSNPGHGDVYSIQHYVIQFVSNLRQVGGFLRVIRFPPPNKTDRHDITEILLKVALNTITAMTGIRTHNVISERHRLHG
jgi:hypothetical protein